MISVKTQRGILVKKNGEFFKIHIFCADLLEFGNMQWITRWFDQHCEWCLLSRWQSKYR